MRGANFNLNYLRYLSYRIGGQCGRLVELLIPCSADIWMFRLSGRDGLRATAVLHPLRGLHPPAPILRLPEALQEVRYETRKV